MQFVRVDGVTLHYETQPAGAGRPVVAFVNSLGTDLRIWDGVRAALPAGIGTVAYDTRGHGLSDTAPTPRGIDDHVADLAGLLAHLGIDRAVICGVSLGGLIAQGLCSRHPERVQALLLSNTGLAIADAAFWKARIDAVKRDGLAPLVDAVMPRWFSPGFLAFGDAALAGYANMLVRQPVSGYAAACAAIRDADFTTSASAVAVPTLCIAGDADLPTPPALVEALARAIPGARYRLIAPAGHLPMIEQPATFAGLLAEFVSNLPGGGT